MSEAQKTAQERIAELQKCLDTIPTVAKLREQIEHLDTERKLIMRLLRLAMDKERRDKKNEPT